MAPECHTLTKAPDGNLTLLARKPVVVLYPYGNAVELFNTKAVAKAHLIVNKLLEVPGADRAKIYHFRDGEWKEVN
jgi:hypothetical protein